MLKQYHRDVFLPRNLEMAVLSTLVKMDGKFHLSRHAAERLKEKGIELPERIPFRACEVVEVTQKDRALYKFLVRFTHDEGRDTCLSLSPKGKVITCWMNERTDQHKTLHKSRYVGG